MVGIFEDFDDDIWVLVYVYGVIVVEIWLLWCVVGKVDLLVDGGGEVVDCVWYYLCFEV